MPRSQRLLKNSLIQFCEMFLRNLTDPLNIIDREYRIIWANRKRAHEHNLSQDDIIGQVCFEIFFSGNKPCPQCLARKVLNTGRSCSTEKSCDLPKGGRVWCEQRAVPIHDSYNRVAYVMVYGILITDKVLIRQRQERRIKELEKTISALKLVPKAFADQRACRYYHASLTVREIEVLHLMAEGQTNPEISQSLSISTHTAKSHVINIFNKLGVNNRTQAAVVATYRQLITH